VCVHFFFIYTHRLDGDIGEQGDNDVEDDDHDVSCKLDQP
jgi:hypothetical protein